MIQKAKPIDISKKESVIVGQPDCGPSFFDSKKSLNNSTLFSKGRRTDKFFTEDSKLYITPREMKLLEKGICLDRKLGKWDNLSSRIISEYKRHTPKNKKNDFLFEEFRRKYEALHEQIEFSSKSLLGQFSFARLGNFSIASVMLFGMLSMSMLYKYSNGDYSDKAAVLGVFDENKIAYVEDSIGNINSIAIPASLSEANNETSSHSVEDPSEVDLMVRESYEQVDVIDESGEDVGSQVTSEMNEDTERLESAENSVVMRDPEEDGGVKNYTVKTGDTISAIAKNHGITINTVLWANDLTDSDSIRPGDQIFILPVSGITHKIKTGDTIEVIAQRYKADKERIIAFNDISESSLLEVGKDIIIPDGQVEDNLYSKENYSGWRDLVGEVGTGHKFPYGYCTWYVSQKKYIPWSGNAGTWLYRAKSLGYKTGKTPKEGAVVVTTEDRYYGHVALVEEVNGDKIKISEMNFDGWAKKSIRTLPVDSPVIRGYIY